MWKFITVTDNEERKQILRLAKKFNPAVMWFFNEETQEWVRVDRDERKDSIRTNKGS